jgi:hypothetical protein
LSQTFGLHTADNQPQNAAAAISATQQIANAIHIVVTFNFRFLCALRTQLGHRAMFENLHTGRHREMWSQRDCCSEGGSQIKPADRRSGGHQCWL